MTILHAGSLTFRFLASILGVTVLALALAMVLLHVEVSRLSDQQTSLAREALTVERQQAETLQSRALNTKAELLGKFMARTAPDLILTYDLDLLARYQAEASSDADIAYAVYLDPQGEPMVDVETRMTEAIETRYPVESHGKLLGHVLIGLDPRNLFVSNEVAAERIDTAIAHAQQLGNTGQARFLAILGIGFIGMLLLLAVLFRFMFRRQVIRPLKDTTALIRELALGGGDLSRRLPIAEDNEIAHLRLAVNAFMENLQGMVRIIVQDILELSRVAAALRESATILVDDMNTAHAHTSQVTTGVDQLLSTIKQVAHSTLQAAAAARVGEDKANDGKTIVAGAVADIQSLSSEVQAASAVIARLEEASTRIGAVLDVIVAISNQTNLLALNAAIEAARAGEHGRGFAVVADEVRSLAVRTQESTLEVRDIVDQVTNGTRNAIDAMELSQSQAGASVAQSEKASAALEAILQAVHTINAMSKEIAAVADEQARVAEVLSQQIVSIDDLSEKTAERAQITHQTSRELTDLADSLHTLVGRFSV
ncbi:methyl-accepting chemotaxis protein [Thiocystis minor]|uniref:methyl-accepting chemotaxis protein n=1 Tax=Thiocystis minor TaxID=61597 RepID=UPI0019126F5A|nr:methyl-accepting chemotaxis protein [Thiocystis minor]